jgi:hypothetical protein
MGRISNQVLGDAQGKVGHIVFRLRKGLNIMGKAPNKRATLPSEKELAIRAKFGLAGQIARAIYSLPQIREIWPKSPGNMTKCNEIFQANYKLINSLANLGTVSVAPNYGFNFANPVVTVGATSVQLASDALGVGIGIDTSIEKYQIMCGIAILQNPTLESWPKSDVVSFHSIQHNLDLINPIDQTANLVGVDLTKFSGYTSRTAFVCLLTLDENSKVIRYSVTVKSV